ncbi:MAG: hypothetical protein ACLFM0_10990, partial [Spirochaetales bacterium]
RALNSVVRENACCRACGMQKPVDIPGFTRGASRGSLPGWKSGRLWYATGYPGMAGSAVFTRLMPAPPWRRGFPAAFPNSSSRF